MDLVLKYRRQLDFKVYIITGKGAVSIYIIIDLGASAIVFINSNFIKQYRLKIILIIIKYKLVLADRGSVADITYIAYIYFRLSNYTKEF